MLDRLGMTMTAACGLAPGALVVAGVSGGPDSLCLMHAMHALGYQVMALHLDHQLRPDSAADAAVVKAAAESMGVPYVLKRLDVAGKARSERLSVEQAGRKARYQFLFEQARSSAAAAVAVGHTADDQVETVLMHVIRGAGLAGLSGMSHSSVIPQFDSRIPLIRPLLACRRSEIESYCLENGLRPVVDSSNASLEYSRNRIRHELLPLLESYNPRVREAILRMAETISSDLSIIEADVAAAWETAVVDQQRDLVSFSAPLLNGLAAPLRRRCLMRAIELLQPDADVGYDTLLGASEFTSGSGSARQPLGRGLFVAREPGLVYVARDGATLEVDGWPQLPRSSVPVSFGTPAAVPLAEGWLFEARVEAVSGRPLDLMADPADGFRACLDADSLPGELQLRWPRPGDRLIPFGMHGHSQKLSDIFVNEKVPSRARARWPVLASNGTVIWVPGYRPAEAYKLRQQTQRAAFFVVSREVTDDP